MPAESLTDVGELVTRFVGDTTSLESAGQRSSAIVSEAAARINETMATAPAAFEGAAASFESTSAQIAAALAPIGEASAVMAESVQASATAAAESLPTISVAAERAAAQIASAGAAAGAGLASIAEGAATATGPVEGLAASIAENKAVMAAFDAEIAGARVEIAQLAARLQEASGNYGANSEAARVLRAELSQLRAVSSGLTADKNALAVETRALTAELRAEQAALAKAAAAAEAEAAANIEGAVAADVSGARHLTLRGEILAASQVGKVAGESWGGYGRAIGGLANAFSLASAGQFALIIGAGLLIGKLIELAKGHKDQIEVVKEAAATYALLAGAQVNAGNATANLAAAIAGGAQNFSASTLAAGNLAVAFDKIGETQTTIEKKTKELADVYNLLNTTGARLWHSTTQGGESITYVVDTAKDLRKEMGVLTTEIDKQEKAMAPAIQSFKLFQNATGASTEDILKAARAQRLLSEDALPRVRQALEGNIQGLQAFISRLVESTNRTVDMTQAALSLSFALANIKAPSFDVSATEQGVRNLFATANAAIATGVKQFQNFQDAAAAAKPSLEAANKGLQQYAAAHAEGATRAERNASTLRIYNQKQQEFVQAGERANAKTKESDGFMEALRKSVEGAASAHNRYLPILGQAATATHDYAKETVAAIGVNKQAAENMRAFADEHKKTAGAARAGRAALNQYRAGVMGALEALEKVSSATPALIARLFEPTAKGASQMSAGWQAAFKSAAEAVTAFLQDQGIATKVTDAELARMVKSGETHLLAYTTAWERAQARIRKAGIDMAEHLPVSLKEVNEFLKAQGYDLKITAETWLQMSAVGKSATMILGSFVKAQKDLHNETTAADEPIKEITTSIIAHNLVLMRALKSYTQGRIKAFEYIDALHGVKDGHRIVAESVLGVATALESVAARNARVIAKFKEGFDNLLALQGLNLKIGIFDTLAAQIDHLATVSGQDKAVVLQNFRDMLAGMGDSSQAMKDRIALIDQAILNSQLARLEAAWGRPLARAIAAILVHFDKLKAITGSLHQTMLGKMTAIGELFAVLPGKIGQSVNRVISTINSVISVAEKALNVLVAFGVKLPKPLQDILDILNKGAGSTTAVMVQMKDEVVRVMTEMARQVLEILRKLNQDIKIELQTNNEVFQKWEKDVDLTTDNLVNDFSKTSGQLGGILSGMGGLFGGLAARVVAAISQIISATRKMGSALPPIYSLVGNSAMQMGNQIGVAMSYAAGQTSAANAQMTSSTARMAGAVIGILGGLITFINSRHQGLAQGAIGGAIGGATVGASIGLLIGGPVGAGIGALIGAAGGAILGLFGTGKTALQKAQDAAQLQQAKDAIKLSEQQVLQAYEQTKQSIADTAAKIKDLLDSMAASTRVPKRVIEDFVKNFTDLLLALADAAAKFQPAQLAALKALSDNTGGAVDELAKLGEVYNAIGAHLGITRAAATRYVADFIMLIEVLAAANEEVAKKTARHARQLADRAGSIPDFVVKQIEALRAVADVPEVPAANFERLEKNTESILTHLSNVFNALDRWELKVAGKAAEEALPILTFTQALSQTLTAAVEQKVPTEADWRNLLDGAQRGFEFVFAFFDSLQAETLTRERALAEQATPITQFISAVFGMLKAGNEAGTIGQIDIAAVKAQALGLLQAIIEIAAEISVQEAAAGSELAAAAKDIPGFASSLAASIKSLVESGGGQVDIASFKAQGHALIQAIVELASEFSADGVAGAKRLSESGIVITAFAKSLADANKALADGARAGDYYVRIAVESFKTMVSLFAQLRTDISPDIFAAAEETARRAAGILSNVQAIASSLKAASEAQIVSASPLVAAVRAWVDELALARDEALRGELISRDFLSLTESTKANVLAGIANLSAAVHAASAALASTGESSTSAASSAAAPLTGSLLPSGAGSTTYNVNVNVQGSVYDRNKFKREVQDAIEERDRRGSAFNA